MMELARKTVNTARMTEAKWILLTQRVLIKEPMTVLEATPKRGEKPEAYIISLSLLDYLIDCSDKYGVLVQGEPFQVLRAENTKLRNLIDEILRKLQRGGGLEIDDDTWQLVRTSIFDGLKGPDEATFASVGDR